MRHATRWNKRDASEADILQMLTQIGVHYALGPPLDLWAYLGTWVPIEIKTAKGVLTPGQRRFVETSKQLGRPVMVWRSVDEALVQIHEFRNQKAIA